MRLIRIYATLAALCTVAYIAFDYAAGHMDAGPADIVLCPVCQVFCASEHVAGIDFTALILSACHQTGVVTAAASPPARDISSHTVSRRGPPSLPAAPGIFANVMGTPIQRGVH